MAQRTRGRGKTGSRRRGRNCAEDEIVQKTTRSRGKEKPRGREKDNRAEEKEIAQKRETARKRKNRAEKRDRAEKTAERGQR